MEIAPSVYQINNTFVFQYLILHNSDLILIDTGINGNHKKILSTIKTLGRSPLDLKKIIITHADGDHFGGLAELQNSTKAVAYAAPIEADAIQAGRSSRPLNPSGIQKMLFSLVAPLVKSQPARIDTRLSGNESFDVLGGLQVIPTPGHTPEHISLYSSSTGILFAGDSIQIVRGEPQASARGNTWNIAKAEESFHKQIDLQPSLILAGHGTWKKK